MSFLQRVPGFCLRERVSSLVIVEGLRVEPLLRHTERIQLRRFRQLIRMGQVFPVGPIIRSTSRKAEVLVVCWSEAFRCVLTQ